MNARLAKISGFGLTSENMDKPTPMTSNAPMAMCLSSFGLNQKILDVGRGGVYVKEYSYGVLSCISVIVDGGVSLRGANAFQYSGHAWFSGSRCSAQKYPLQ